MENISTILESWNNDKLEFQKISNDTSYPEYIRDIYGALHTITKIHINNLRGVQRAKRPKRSPNNKVDPEQLSVYDNILLGKKDHCYYCSDITETNKDHFWPKSIGGKLKVHACIKCNRLKKNRTPQAWIFYLNGLSHKTQDTDDIIHIDKMIKVTKELWDKVKWSI